MQRLMVLVIFAFLGCTKDSAAPTPASELKPLTVEQVATRIAAHDGKTYIFDNNSKETWTKGHVPTATWVDDENVTAATMPPNKSATLIFYCHDET